MPLNSDQRELEKLFLDFGIDLSGFGLVHDLDKSETFDSNHFLLKGEPVSYPDYFLAQSEEIESSSVSKVQSSEDENENANEIPPKSRSKRKTIDELEPEGGQKSSSLSMWEY